MKVVKLAALSGRMVEYVEEAPVQGGMKDVYFSPDRSYVVAFFRKPLDSQGKERLHSIVGRYRESIFEREGGEYWRNLFCWPMDMVEKDGLPGVVTPVYQSHFFFQHGSVNGDMVGIKGHEKQGKWFASDLNRTRILPPEEKGDWRTHLQICLMISRAVRRLHAAGLAHSDLSYRNVLVDPVGGRACIIDIDGLVVPGKFAPDVVGTPDFIAPEVVATQHLDRNDPQRKLPSIVTDRHALAVLIYMYLFYRHPLRGGKRHDSDPKREEAMMMGADALFVEHPSDASNRVKISELGKHNTIWSDPSRTPYAIAGPFLAELFRKAFVEGLRDPQARPSADEWERALIRTADMLHPCPSGCEMKWHVFDAARPRCPYCEAAYATLPPLLHLHSVRQRGEFRPDDHQVAVWDGLSLLPRHMNRKTPSAEHAGPEHIRRIGYVRRHRDRWILVNEAMPQMHDRRGNRDIPIGGSITLPEGAEILLSREEGGRMIRVQTSR